jgi:hypothetical protein
MAKRAARTPEDFALRGLHYTQEQIEDVLGQTEKYVRANPGQALLYAFVAGYVLNRLPVGRVVGGLVRLSMFALKPAVLIYGATKVYEVLQEE